MERYGLEWWLKNQLADDPEIVERYQVTFSDRGMRIGCLTEAYEAYRKQNNADWRKWRRCVHPAQAGRFPENA